MEENQNKQRRGIMAESTNRIREVCPGGGDNSNSEIFIERGKE